MLSAHSDSVNSTPKTLLPSYSGDFEVIGFLSTHGPLLPFFALNLTDQLSLKPSGTAKYTIIGYVMALLVASSTG